METRRGQQGKRWSRRTDDRTDRRGTQDPVAQDPGGTPKRALSTASGSPRGDPEAGRRGAGIGNPNRGGSTDPTGLAASSSTVDRPDVLGVQLRISAGPERP